jgi:hypothetical protein
VPSSGGIWPEMLLFCNNLHITKKLKHKEFSINHKAIYEVVKYYSLFYISILEQMNKDTPALYFVAEAEFRAT